LESTIKPRRKVDPNKYQTQRFIKGSAEEKTFCAFLCFTASRTISLNPKQFLMVYIEMLKTVYAGLQIDFKLQPILKNTQLAKDIHQLKGGELKSLLEQSVFEKIVFFLFGGDKKFCAEAKIEFTIFEAKLLLSDFFPTLG